MTTPVQVTFLGMPVSDAVEFRAGKEVDKLSREFEQIASCQVVIGRACDRSRYSQGFKVIHRCAAATTEFDRRSTEKLRLRDRPLLQKEVQF